MCYRGMVTAFGLAAGMFWPASVAPFILRGITLAGIDSVMAPVDERLQAWRQLAQDLDRDLLERLTREIDLKDAMSVAADLLEGHVCGRVVVPCLTYDLFGKANGVNSGYESVQTRQARYRDCSLQRIFSASTPHLHLRVSFITRDVAQIHESQE